MNKEEMKQSLKVCRDEYEYFKKRYNEETDQETKDGLGFCIMLAQAGIEEYTLQLEKQTKKVVACLRKQGQTEVNKLCDKFNQVQKLK